MLLRSWGGIKHGQVTKVAPARQYCCVQVMGMIFLQPFSHHLPVLLPSPQVSICIPVVDPAWCTDYYDLSDAALAVLEQTMNVSEYR